MVFEFAGLPRLIENNKLIFVLLFPRYSTVVKLRAIDLKLQIMGFDFQIQNFESAYDFLFAITRSHPVLMKPSRPQNHRS